MIQELETNVENETKMEAGISNPQSTTSREDTNIISMALFSQFLIDSCDLLGIKGINKTKQVFKKVQKFWLQNKEEGLRQLQELKEIRASGIVYQRVYRPGNTTRRISTSNDKHGRQTEIVRRSGATVDQESAVYLSTN